jgi:hypothetical protein
MELLRGALDAADERLRKAGERVGIYCGCDTPDALADEIERLRTVERRTKAIVGWLEVMQPDVFKRGLWDAISTADEASDAP